jgi:sigma-B regulation protein RsbU (phosphoserine phosphatase)
MQGNKPPVILHGIIPQNTFRDRDDMTDRTGTFPRLTVRAKILAIFLVLSLLSLLITGFITFFIISDIGNYAMDSSSTLGKEATADSTSTLEQVTTEYMLRIASDQAEITDVLFIETEDEMAILAAHAATLANNPSFTPIIRSYPLNQPPPDPFAATDFSLVPGSAATPLTEEYQSLAGIDDLLRAVYVADGDLTSVYVATDSGIMRSYPWSGSWEMGYDPRDRSWFSAAKKAGNTVWTGPYVDESGHGLIVTCSYAVATKYGTWVVAADITTDQLNRYTNLTMGGKGYTVLMDSAGNIISRPGLSANGTRWNEAFLTENVYNSGNAGLIAVGKNMTAGKNGLERVRVNDNEIFVAYAPVKALNWSFAVSMPGEEIVAPIAITSEKIASSTLDTAQHIEKQTGRIRDIFAGLFCLLLIIVIVLSVFLARVITRPVEALIGGTTALGRGDLDYRVSIRTGDEFEELADSFNRMSADLKASIADLRRTTAEKERYAKELEIAKEIQESFLPESTPEIPGMEIAAVTVPAMEIGGDLYDFIPVCDGRWGLAIADVSGKGVSAALFMALSRTLIHASGSAEIDPSVALRRANRLIYEDAKSSMFITVFYGVLDAERLEFSYVNAGHNPPFLLRGDPAVVRPLPGRGIALGVVPEVDIPRSELELEHGDLIAMFTDGVTEAFNGQDEPFGEERLSGFLLANRSRPLAEIIPALLDEIKKFCGSTPQSDDITLVLVKVK